MTIDNLLSELEALRKLLHGTCEVVLRYSWNKTDTPICTPRLTGGKIVVNTDEHIDEIADTEQVVHWERIPVVGIPKKEWPVCNSRRKYRACRCEYCGTPIWVTRHAWDSVGVDSTSIICLDCYEAIYKTSGA